MKHSWVICISLFCVQSLCIAQTPPNSIWFGGYHFPAKDVPDSIYHLIWNTGDPIITKNTSPYSFEATMAAVNDSEGNLLFYTNGCMIANANHDIIPGGDGLNPGVIHNEVCQEVGYIAEQGTVFLQLPGATSTWVLIHMGISRDTLIPARYGPLYYTLVQKNNGTYSVISKNNILLDGYLERITCLRHGNGRDWWILIPEMGTNTYHSFLLQPNGIKKVNTQSIGPSISIQAGRTGFGQSAFSPDGRFYGRYNRRFGPIFFDFDRCTGLLSNPVHVKPKEYLFGGGGLVFGKDSAWALLDVQKKLYKIYFKSSNPEYIEVAQTNPIWGTTFSEMVWSPLYDYIIMRPVSMENYYHTIQPFKWGVNVQFKNKYIPLGQNCSRTLPVDVNYQLGAFKGSACDTITATPELPFFDLKEITCNPNPASRLTTLSFIGKNQQVPVKIVLRTMDNKILKIISEHIFSGMQLDVSELPNGTYMCEIFYISHASKLLKLIVVH